MAACSGAAKWIVDPLGNVLVEPNFGGEAAHLVDLDRRIIARGKYDLDVAGHYARPDVFNLSVDTRPKSPVSFVAVQNGIGSILGKTRQAMEVKEGTCACLD